MPVPEDDASPAEREQAAQQEADGRRRSSDVLAKAAENYRRQLKAQRRAPSTT